MDETSIITLADVQAAAERIGDRVRVSPFAETVALSEITGTRLYLKLENRQRTGSFKERGACNYLQSLSELERARGVVTASAGNHAQAVALHASRLGIRAYIVMPETTPLVKIESTRRFGAEVELFGKNYDEAAERAAVLQQQYNLEYVHPFDDPRVIAGQGTLGLELLAQCPELEAVVVPVGGGGLLAGVACAIKETRPDVRVYGVESRDFPGMKRALESDTFPSLPPGKTIADGIAVRRVGRYTIPLVRKYVDDIVLVDEEEIAEAILLLLEKEKTVAEGAGAVGLAALVHRHLNLEGQRVAVILSGGNIDVSLMARIIERGLVKTGRRVRLFLTAPDVAGTLARLTSVVASCGANILEINHDRAFSEAELGHSSIELVLETHGFEHIGFVQSRLAEAGYPTHAAALPSRLASALAQASVSRSPH
ncbi:MAG TPA: threonine ammonia-lyase [Polyangiaceae bacterium]|nr:threonine ammonia-lyase [Polyangiaceae bacterium]